MTADRFTLSSTQEHRARIYKRLRSPGIDSEESIPPAYVAWRAMQLRQIL